MQFKQTDNIFQVYLEKGELVVNELTNFCKEQKILNGQITGIGAVNNIELGAYNSKTGEYIKKKFINDYELITYQGNIMLLDGESFIHAHVTIGNHRMQIFGGHLFKATIAVVGEFIISKIDSNSIRSFSDKIGLATWDLDNKE